MSYQVPAVRSTVRILRHLHAQDGVACGVSSVARSLGLNISTCFNILKTLQAEGFVDFDAGDRTYRLGRELIGLAIRAGTTTESVGRALPLMRQLVVDLDLTCIATVLLPDDHVLVVEKVEALGPAVKLTASLGQRFHPLSPVLAKAFWAWAPAEEVAALLARQAGAPAFTSRSRLDREGFAAELDFTRRHGYSRSLQEYYDWSNSVGAPVFNAQGRVAFVIAVLGNISDFPEDRVPSHGARLAATAEQITVLVGGRAPAVDAGG